MGPKMPGLTIRRHNRIESHHIGHCPRGPDRVAIGSPELMTAIKREQEQGL